MSKARKISKVLGTSDKLTATAFANVTDLAGVDVYADSDTFVAAVASGTVRQGRMAYFRNSGRIKQRRGSDWNEMTYEAPLADASYTIQSVTPNPVDEGVTVTAYIHVINDDSTIYWTINGTTEDFSAISGSSDYSVATPGGISKITYSHVITFNTIADLTTEGNETFILSVRTDSISGTVKDTYEFSVNDTSETPPYAPNQSIKIMTNYSILDPAASYDFVVPPNVYSVCWVMIGAGGGGATIGTNRVANGGDGGGLIWKNDVAVTPGEVLTVRVGHYAPGRPGGMTNVANNISQQNYGYIGGTSSVYRSNQLLGCAMGGVGADFFLNNLAGQGNYEYNSPDVTLYRLGGFVGGGNGAGYRGGMGWNTINASSSTWLALGGGGAAAGYAAAGARAGLNAAAGSGGGQGGAFMPARTRDPGWHSGGKGGGTGVYGLGFSATSAIARVGLNGQAGSGGDSLSANSAIDSQNFGGGGAPVGTVNLYSGVGVVAANSSPGCVRILWGDGRAFPSTNVDYESSLDGETVVYVTPD